MTDLASLVIGIDSTSAKGAKVDLDNLAAAGAKAEATAKTLAAAQAAEKVETDKLRESLKAGTISQTAFNEAMLRAKVATGVAQTEYRQAISNLQKFRTANDDAAAAMARNGYAARNLGQQFGDFGQQAMQDGVGPLRAFSMQIGQVGFALGEFQSGPLRSVGAFLTGPWGIALTLAATAVAMFADKMATASEEAEKLAKKQGLVKLSADDLVIAIDELAVAQDEAGKSARARLVDAENLARGYYAQAVAARDAAKAALEQAKASAIATQQTGAMTGAEGGTGAIATGQLRVAALDAEMKRLDASTVKAGNAFRAAQFDLAAYGIETGKNAKAEGDFRDKMTATREAFAQGNSTLSEAIALGQQHKAALDAVTEADKRAAEAKRQHNKETREAAKAARDAAKAAKEQVEEQLRAFARIPVLQLNDPRVEVKPIDTSRLTTPWQEAEKSVEAYRESVASIEDTVSRVGDAIADAFGRGGTAIADAMEIALQYGNDLEALRKQEALGLIDNATYRQKSSKIALEGTTAFLSASKSLFSEHSKGYKAMAAAEQALAAVQAVRTAAKVAEGAASMFAALGPFGFPAVAAMLAVMASLGFKGGGGGVSGAYKAEDVQKRQGAGSVLGDRSAKSDSISQALDLVAKNTDSQLEYSNEMLRSLRSIDNSIGVLASQLARQIGINAGNTEGLGLGSKYGNTIGGKGVVGAALGVGAAAASVSGLAMAGLALGPVGALLGAAVGLVVTKLPVIGDIIGGITKALFGTKVTRTLVDQGVTFYASTLAEIMAGGIEGANYSLVEIKKKKKLFGISTGTSTKTQEYTSELDSAVEQQATLLLTNIYESVVAATKTIGMEGVDQLLQSFQVDLGKISLKDLKGDEITEAISAVFSKAADDMAQAALPGLELFQKVGEGTFETLIRLATDYQTIDVQLGAIGRTFGAVGVASIAARESLLDLFGGLDEFVSSITFYREKFLTDAEQIAPVMTAVEAELARLNLTGIDTIDSFKMVVNGLDLTTEAGQSLYAALMALAPGFKAVQDYFAKQMKAADDAVASAGDAMKAAFADILDVEASAIQAYNSAVEAQQQAAIQAQASAMQDALGGLAEEVRKFVDQAERLREFSATIFDDVRGVQFSRSGVTAAAQAGDIQALQRFRDAAMAGDRISAMRNLAFIRNEVDKAATSAEARGASAQSQADVLQAQLNALQKTADRSTDIALLLSNMQTAKAAADLARAQMAKFTELTDNQVTFTDTVAAYEAAKTDRDNLMRQITEAGFSGLIVAQQQTAAQMIAAATAAYNLAAQAQAAAEQASAQATAVAAAVNDNAPWMEYLNGIPMFAAGGTHGGGLRVVGERGWEVEATGPSRVWNAEQIGSAMNADMAREVRALREEVSRMRAESKALGESIALSNNQMARDLRGTIKGGTMTVRTDSDDPLATVAA